MTGVQTCALPIYWEGERVTPVVEPDRIDIPDVIPPDVIFPAIPGLSPLFGKSGAEPKSTEDEDT